MASPSSRIRSRQQFTRTPGNRAPRARVLVVCEDSKASPGYFRDLCRDLRITAEVEVCGASHPTPDKVVEHARKRLKEIDQESLRVPFDQAWCVCDVDQHSTLQKAIQRAKSDGIRMALSNPAIEYWFLLHFESTDRPFLTPDHLVKALKKHFPSFSKSRPIYAHLAGSTDEAIKRARAFAGKRASKEAGPQANPSTDVHLLVEVLQGIAEKPYSTAPTRRGDRT